MFKISRRGFALPACLTAVGLVVVAGTMAFADPKKDAPKGGMPEMKLPPGWTQEEFMKCMQDCQAAGTPGEMHKVLAAGAGTWVGQTKMWQLPGMDPISYETTTVVKSLYGDRYISCEISGEMPGWGPFHGVSTHAFDNASGKFQSSWICNHSTAIATGNGELSSDGKTMTWTYTSTCPSTKKPVTMREVVTTTGKDTKVMEMFVPDMKTGKEFKMLEIKMTRKNAATK